MMMMMMNALLTFCKRIRHAFLSLFFEQKKDFVSDATDRLCLPSLFRRKAHMVKSSKTRNSFTVFVPLLYTACSLDNLQNLLVGKCVFILVYTSWMYIMEYILSHHI